MNLEMPPRRRFCNNKLQQALESFVMLSRKKTTLKEVRVQGSLTADLDWTILQFTDLCDIKETRKVSEMI